MAVKPWMDSNNLIAAIKRKISFPIAQNTFTEDDILAFCNEEMMISQVPSVLSYHEEYFVTTQEVSIEPEKTHYPIPERAIGQKLRDIFFKDDQGNLFEMTRVNSEDRAFFQRNIGANQAIHKFYLEGNDVVITPKPTATPSGSLLFVYYLRPNQLVLNERAAIIKYFTKNITIDNTTLVAGDTLTIGDITFTAVSGTPSSLEFQIGATSTQTAANLATAIINDQTYTASSSSNILTVKYEVLNTTITTTNSTSFSLSSFKDIEFESIPSNITNSSIIDFLQTKSGHKTRKMDVKIGLNAISGTTISFNSSDIPSDLEIGDYICLAGECIIPQIPTDLHTGLAERSCARILAAIGDQQGLQATNLKIQEIEQRQGPLLDSRVEGAPNKILARHSLLRYGKRGTIRRT